MFELLKEINWNLIFSLMVVSAVVAWAGDYIGMKLGKKRITFLKLRPKHTSRIISILTGVGIAFLTLFAISVASEPVRTALFSMNFVQKQVTDLTAELQTNRSNLQAMEVELFQNKGNLNEKQMELQIVEDKLKSGTAALNEARSKLMNMEEKMKKASSEQEELEKANLKLKQESKKLETSVQEMKHESAELREGIQRLREGRIAALTGELLAQGIIQQDKISQAEAQHIISRLSDESCALLAYRFGKKKNEIQPPKIDEKSILSVKKVLTAGYGARWLVRMTAQSNAVEGEPVMTRIEAFKTRQIFKAKEVLHEINIKSGTPRNDVESLIFRALKELNMMAAKEGVMRDPLTGNIGSLDTAELMDILDAVTESKKDVKIIMTAADDIYTEGPLRVRCTIKNN